LCDKEYFNLGGNGTCDNEVFLKEILEKVTGYNIV